MPRRIGIFPGGGTTAARRPIKSSGWKTNASVPSLHDDYYENVRIEAGGKERTANATAPAGARVLRLDSSFGSTVTGRYAFDDEPLQMVDRILEPLENARSWVLGGQIPLDQSSQRYVLQYHWVDVLVEEAAFRGSRIGPRSRGSG